MNRLIVSLPSSTSTTSSSDSSEPVRDQTRDQLAGHATHTDLHALSATSAGGDVQRWKSATGVAGFGSTSWVAACVMRWMRCDRAGWSAGVHAEEDAEAEKMLHIALETRGVLDDMMAAVDQDNQQQAIDAIRQHVSTQLQAVDGRLHACERHVNSAVVAQSRSRSASAPSRQAHDWAMEAVRVRCDHQEAVCTAMARRHYTAAAAYEPHHARFGRQA